MWLLKVVVHRWSLCVIMYLVLFVLGANLLPFNENWWWEKVGSALYGRLGDGEEAEANTEFLVGLIHILYISGVIMLVRLIIRLKHACYNFDK